MAGAKHTLFLVHGMGEHEPNTWARRVVLKLEEVASRFGSFQGHSLGEWVRFQPIDYDQHIRAAVRRWTAEGGKFLEFAARNKLVDGAKLDWVGDLQGEELEFFRKRLLDVLLYRFFELEQGRVQDSVKLQFAKTIEVELAADTSSEFSVLAHSLGCAVAHDALAELGANTLDGTPNALGVASFRFKSIHMLANISRLLQTRIKAYESCVKPGARDNKQSYCLRYYDYRHEFDPVTIVKRFEPTWSSDYFTATLVRHYRCWDIHAFTHYLDNPRVHVPILNQITWSSAISRPEFTRAVAAYEQFGGDFAFVPATRERISELGALQARLREDSSLGEMFATSRAMFASLRSILAELKRVKPGVLEEC